jgi:hypothetical protein
MANIKDLIQSIESSDSSFDEKLAAINEMEETLVAMRSQEQEAIDDNVSLIVEAIKVMERKVEAQLEAAKAIVPEKGDKGEPGKEGRDGQPGRDGQDGRDGQNGNDGRDGADGVSVTDAKIDFDGSLVITLSTGREINVGEVVAPDLAEKIKVISTMSTNTAIADITGGSINGTTIGSTTPAAGTFTTLASTGQADLGGISGQESLRVVSVGTATTPMRVAGTGATAGGFFSPGSIAFACGSTQMSFRSGASATSPSAGPEQMRVSHTASAVNYVQVTGAATGAGVVISSQGSDTSPPMLYSAKGFSSHRFYTNGGTTDEQFRIYNTTTSRNYFQVTGAVTGNSPKFEVAGSDTNISQVFQSKGTGAIDLAAGSSGVNISNGGTVTAITRTANGSGYTTAPSANITTPTTAGGVQAVLQTTMYLVDVPTIAGGGTGYTVGNVLTFVGGTFTTAAQVTVATVSAGVITSISVTTNGTYTALPTNPVSVTGGAGSGATFTVNWRVFGCNITTAGSGYVEQPTVTFSGGGGSGAAAYASVGGQTVIKTIGPSILFNTPTGGTGFAVLDSSSTGAAYWAAIPGTGTAILRAIGSSSGQIGTQSGVPVQLVTNTSVEQARIAHTASAVNYLQVTGAATGGRPTLSAQGSDTNVGMAYNTKGAQNHVFSTNSGNLQFVVANRASTVNWVQAQGNTAGNPPSFTADGSDTNIDLSLIPKGTGNVRFGTYTGTVLTPTGYVEIKDAGGTIRRLLVG